MRLRTLFKRLCEYTTPHGREAWCWSWIPNKVWIDFLGNVFSYVPHPDPKVKANTMFACHCDTVGSEVKKVRVIDAGRWIHTDEKTILGADDKIGVALAIKMINCKVPGWYAFFAGEERGCIGSRNIAEGMKGKNPRVTRDPAVNKVISLDRHSNRSIITHQGSMRTCSDAFAQALAEQLDMDHELDQGGLLTDSKQFVDLMAECTNLSVGYVDHHHTSERVDMEYCEELLKRMCIVDWQNLPIQRVPGSMVYDKTYSWNVHDKEDDKSHPKTYTSFVTPCQSRANVSESYGHDRDLAWIDKHTKIGVGIDWDNISLNEMYACPWDSLTDEEWKVGRLRLAFLTNSEQMCIRSKGTNGNPDKYEWIPNPHHTPSVLTSGKRVTRIGEEAPLPGVPDMGKVLTSETLKFPLECPKCEERYTSDDYHCRFCTTCGMPLVLPVV